MWACKLNYMMLNNKLKSNNFWGRIILGRFHRPRLLWAIQVTCFTIKWLILTRFIFGLLVLESGVVAVNSSNSTKIVISEKNHFWWNLQPSRLQVCTEFFFSFTVGFLNIGLVWYLKGSVACCMGLNKYTSLWWAFIQTS